MAEADRAVVDAPDDQAGDKKAKPGQEGSDARKPVDDLDALLDEFKVAGTTTPATSDTKTVTDAAAADNDLKREVKALRETLAEDRFNREIIPVIKTVRGEIPEDVFSDSEIRDWIDGEAGRDKRLAAAWAARAEKPKEFQRVVDGLSRKFNAKFSKLPDKGASEDRDAVTDAVRRASTRTPDSGKAPNYSQMSDADFAAQVKKEHGFRPL